MSKTADQARVSTRQVRERQADAELTVTRGERAELSCPACGETCEVAIHGDQDVSFGNCWNWDCDAFLKLSIEDRDDIESAGQQTLGRWSA